MKQFDSKSSTILPGDEVVVLVDHHVALEGFLDVSRGAFLEVQHVSSVGNLFCAVLRSRLRENRDQDPEVGWLRRAYVSEASRNVGDLLVVRHGATKPYCPCIQDDILEVISTELPDAERLWCQNQRNHSLGWIPLANLLRRMSDAEARKWKQEHWNRSQCIQLEALRQYRRVQSSTELLPFPSASRQWYDYQVEVAVDELVELLEESENFTKVKLLSTQILGWIPTSCLGAMVSAHPKTEPSRPSQGTREEEAPASQLADESRPASAQVSTPSLSTVPDAFFDEVEVLAPKPPPEFRDRKILLYSFGIETLDPELTQMCQSLGGGARCRIPLVDIAAALHRQRVDADIVLDARDFPDPNSWALSQLGHSGRHYQIVGNLFCHRNFWHWLKDVKLRFQRELERETATEGGAASITIAIYCKRGKHRSVAATVILQHILRAEGYDCSDWHLSYKRWCCYLDCEVCSNPPQELQAHLDKALEYWRSFT